MKHKYIYILITLAVLVGSLAYVMYQNRVSPVGTPPPPEASVTTSVPTASATPPEATPTETRPTPPETYGPADIFGERKGFGELVSMIKEATGLEVRFEDQHNKARNSRYDVYIDGEMVGIVATQDIALLDSSSNQRKFSFRKRSQIGCCSSHFEIIVIDLMEKSLHSIRAPRKSKLYLDPTGNPWDLDAVIADYEWETDSTLGVTFYFAVNIGGGKYRRASPIEIWRYDLATEEYTLLETLPEESD